MSNVFTGKQRMLNAYRGIKNDRPAVAPEFWYYYPAKLLGVDMIEFEREVPLHLALKKTFEEFNCEGWGIVFAPIPNDRVRIIEEEKWIEEGRLEVTRTFKTPRGQLHSRQVFCRDNPSWVTDRPVKKLEDLEIWEDIQFGDPASIDVDPLIKAYHEVGESYLLEAWLGVPFFDFYSEGRQGGFESGIYDFCNPQLESYLLKLQQKYIEMMVSLAATICRKTPLESVCIGCEWSCNSLLGADMWRKWDKPVIAAVADEVHRHGKLIHIHFHGRCMETLHDFAQVGIDCVCPFERPPGGDVNGLESLKQVAAALNGRTTMNGNVNTVSTLIGGTPQDVRNEVREILTAFKGNPRLIIGTGDQVGRETPLENLLAMMDEARRPI